jgi:hypothetical protein
VDKSRFYAALTALYPREFRDRFGSEMIQTHHDQCREVLARPAGSGRFFAWFALWLQTLADWFVSVLREHITDPNRSTGLLESPVDAPLPWKGVLLVLLPGLAFFIAQIGQLSGVDWFFYLMYRGAYFMMVPVLIVWIWKKRFPVWGLIPFGLLIRTILNYFSNVDSLSRYYEILVRYYIHLQPGTQPDIVHLTQVAVGRMQAGYSTFIWAFTALMFTASLIMFAILLKHKSRKHLVVTAFVGYFLVFMATGILASLDYYQSSLGTLSNPYPAAYAMDFLAYDLQSVLYTAGGFLLTVMVGGLFSRRHGRLALLLPLGYLISSTIYGRINTTWMVNDDYTFRLFTVTSVVALLFRFVVAVAGPLWITRSPTSNRSKWAAAVSLVIVVGLQFGFAIWLSAPTWGDQFFIEWFFSGTKWCFAYLAGYGLALAAYIDLPPVSAAQPIVRAAADSPV